MAEKPPSFIRRSLCEKSSETSMCGTHWDSRASKLRCQLL